MVRERERDGGFKRGTVFPTLRTKHRFPSHDALGPSRRSHSLKVQLYVSFASNGRATVVSRKPSGVPVLIIAGRFGFR